jgi:hypothetical protein
MRKDPEEPRSSGGFVRKLIFWEFPRTSWQYDLVVAAILVFIFATPREWFSDQPRAANITFISSSHGYNLVFLEPSLLSDVPEPLRARKAADLIKQKTGKNLPVIRVEPIRDEAEKELKGFIAYTTQHN